MTPHVPLQAWAPDADPTTPGVMTDVDNMLPTQRGYAPEWGLDYNIYAPYVTLSGPACGAATVSYATNSDMPVVATATNIYGVWGSALQDISRAGAAYNLAYPDAPWRFDSFGDKLLAVQFANTLQVSVSAPFGQLRNATGAPNASTIATQRGFVLLGNYGFGGTISDGWICSALEDPDDWTVDIATQCAQGRLTATPGAITRLLAFQDYVIAFKKRGVYRGTYVGAADNTWAWPVVSTEIGLIAHDAVCEAEGVLYWMGPQGFYRWSGGTIQRIGSAPWEWLLAFVGDESRIASNIQCIWDPVRRVVRWLIKTLDSDGLGRVCIAYHPESDRWGKSRLKAEWMFTWPFEYVSMVNGATLVYRTGVPVFIGDARGNQHEILAQRGDAMASSFTTGDIGDDEQVFTLTDVRTRFIGTAPSSVATHHYRMRLDDALTVGASAPRSDGAYNFSQAARWHRLKFAQSGMYELSGFRVEMPRAGKR